MKRRIPSFIDVDTMIDIEIANILVDSIMPMIEESIKNCPEDIYEKPRKLTLKEKRELR